MEDGPEAMVDPGDALWVRPDGDLESSFRSCLSENPTAVQIPYRYYGRSLAEPDL